jgi:hypothetical protein
MSGDADRALDHYRTAARLTNSIPERNYLIGKATRLTSQSRS